MDVTTGLAGLTRTLPLVERQRALSPDVARIHRTVLHTYADEGRPPTAGDLGLTPAEFLAVVETLAAADLVVATSPGDIAGAYPFSSRPTGHRVTIGGATTVEAMCSLDALAVAPMFGLDTRIESTCEITSTPIEIVMTGREVVTVAPPTPSIGIGFQDPGGCAADSLCRHMVFLADDAAADAWQATTGDGAAVFDLPAAIDLAESFFRPLLDETFRGRTG